MMVGDFNTLPNALTVRRTRPLHPPLPHGKDYASRLVRSVDVSCFTNSIKIIIELIYFA